MVDDNVLAQVDLRDGRVPTGQARVGRLSLVLTSSFFKGPARVTTFDLPGFATFGVALPCPAGELVQRLRDRTSAS